MQNINSNVGYDLKSRSYRFSLEVIKFVDSFNLSQSSKVISNQLIRATTSVGANLIEAKASSSRLEYKKYFEISLKSANETIYWLELVRDAKLSSDSHRAEILLKEATELSLMLGNSVLTLKYKLR